MNYNLLRHKNNIIFINIMECKYVTEEKIKRKRENLYITHIWSHLL